MKRIPYTYLGYDFIAVVIFALIGRTSHQHGLSFVGVLETAAPFLLATLIGFIVGRFVAQRLIAQGFIVWLFAVNLGMILRVAFGGGFALSFYIVTAVFLLVVILGWRLLLRKRVS